jgi:hypothetical protein
MSVLLGKRNQRGTVLPVVTICAERQMQSVLTIAPERSRQEILRGRAGGRERNTCQEDKHPGVTEESPAGFNVHASGEIEQRRKSGQPLNSDRRASWIARFLNSISNAAYLLVGLMGLSLLARERRTNEPGGFIESSQRWAYTVFFLGVILTGFGSARHHWKPSEATLVWDRLPMTLAFMSEHVSVLLLGELAWRAILQGDVVAFPTACHPWCSHSSAAYLLAIPCLSPTYPSRDGSIQIWEDR